ncbi:hypothetical protein AAC387_Pa08g2443 [Persea americana]
MIGWLCKAGFVDDAQQLFDKMATDFWFPEVMEYHAVELFKADMCLSRYNALLGKLIHNEKFDVAMAVYTDMLKRNIHRNCDTFNCAFYLIQNLVEFHPKDMQIVGWLCKVGFIHEAQETFDKIREDSLLMDRMWRALGEQQQLL